MFGRLADGATLAEAQAELTAIGSGATAAGPDTRATLRLRIRPYAKSVLVVTEMLDGLKMAPAVLLSIQAFLILLVILICGNVALLMFARAATRESEIVVRNALGASRRRIIGQLFAEALVLAGVGAAIGLIAADLGIRWKFGLIDGAGMGISDSGLVDLLGAPRFWDRSGLAPLTIAYACVLAVIAAVVAGVVPALEVTRGLGARLRQATPGAGGFRFGGVWTAVVVAQVAAMVALPVLAFYVRGEAAKIRSIDFGFPVEEFLSVRLMMDREAGVGGPAVAGATYEVLKERRRQGPGRPQSDRPSRSLRADPGVGRACLAGRTMVRDHRCRERHRQADGRRSGTRRDLPRRRTGLRDVGTAGGACQGRPGALRAATPFDSCRGGSDAQAPRRDPAG